MTLYTNLYDNIEIISKNRNWGNYLSLLGGRKGYCFGLVHMWGLSILVNEEEKFYHRMELLTRDFKLNPYSGFKSIEELFDNISSLKLEKSNDRKILNSIRAFLDSLLLYHAPTSTSLFKDGADSELSTEQAVPSSRYAMSSKIEIRGENGLSLPLVTIFNKSFTGKQKDYSKIICQVIQELKTVKVPYFVEYNSLHHCIGMYYDSLNETVRFYDANFMQANERLYQKLDKELIHITGPMLYELFENESAKKLELLPINIAVYVSPKKEILNKQLSQSKNFIGIKQRLTKKMNKYSQWKLNQWHRHKSRAEHIAKKIKLINEPEELNNFLMHELYLVSSEIRNKEAKQEIPSTHYKQSKQTQTTHQSLYLQIILDGLNFLTPGFHHLKKRLIIRLNRYRQWNANQWHKHKSRAEYTAKQIASIQKPEQLNNYLKDELYLICPEVRKNKRKGKIYADHYLRNKQTQTAQDSQYLKIIKDFSAYVSFTFLNPLNDYYFKEHLPYVIKNEYHKLSPLLSLVSKYDHIETAKLLIDEGSNVNEHYLVTNRSTPLWYAAQDQRLQMIQFLIDSGAEVEKKNQLGITPLMIACAQGSIKAVKLLLKNGAKINVASNDLSTPLMYACIRENLEMTKLFLLRDAQINQADDNGNTPLIFACETGNTQLVKLLLENEADVNLRTQKGQTAITIARKYKKDDILYLLKIYKRKANQKKIMNRPNDHIAT
ncbi:MAG: ankyrin repeat domain-containing protein [Desulfobacteraceae bacterium]|nr:ankyrin repeat domain-containing protein [Desulfobacteraceae bacterium]